MCFLSAESLVCVVIRNLDPAVPLPEEFLETRLWDWSLMTSDVQCLSVFTITLQVIMCVKGHRQNGPCHLNRLLGVVPIWWCTACNTHDLQIARELIQFAHLSYVSLPADSQTADGCVRHVKFCNPKAQIIAGAFVLGCYPRQVINIFSRRTDFWEVYLTQKLVLHKVVKFLSCLFSLKVIQSLYLLGH